jgi:hypothetical protein
MEPGRKRIVIDGMEIPFDLVVAQQAPDLEDMEIRFSVQQGDGSVSADSISTGLLVGEKYRIEVVFSTPPDSEIKQLEVKRRLVPRRAGAQTMDFPPAIAYRSRVAPNVFRTEWLDSYDQLHRESKELIASCLLLGDPKKRSKKATLALDAAVARIVGPDVVKWGETVEYRLLLVDRAFENRTARPRPWDPTVKWAIAPKLKGFKVTGTTRTGRLHVPDEATPFQDEEITLTADGRGPIGPGPARVRGARKRIRVFGVAQVAREKKWTRYKLRVRPGGLHVDRIWLRKGMYQERELAPGRILVWLIIYDYPIYYGGKRRGWGRNPEPTDRIVEFVDSATGGMQAVKRVRALADKFEAGSEDRRTIRQRIREAVERNLKKR